jgi:tetratricopeptide (TPR) repeat protein
MARAKINKKGNAAKKVPAENMTLWNIAFWGLAVLLFLPPYFRGLFFPQEQEKALIFATMIFWLAILWRWLKRDKDFLRGPLDWFAVALPVVYIISTFTAVNKSYAIDEAVKYILYFFTYWSVSRLIKNRDDVHKLLQVIYISAVGVALAGLATATGIININDGFAKSTGYISSTFQYHNALAVYLGGVLFLGIYLWQRACDSVGRVDSEATKKNKKYKILFINCLSYFYACGNFLLLTVFIGSGSRGALLVLGLVFIVYLIGLGNRTRLNATVITGYLGVISFLIIGRFVALVKAGNYSSSWLWVLVGIVLALAGQAAFSVLDRRLFERWSGDGRKYLVTFSALAGVVIVAGIIWLGGNSQIIEKVTSAKYLSTAFQRFYYVQSAVDMVKERPVLGWGGGGWKEAYESFLSYRYATKEVHSYYFQVAVETGVLGILVVLGIWMSFLFRIYKLYFGERNTLHRELALLLFAVFLMIGGHAFIDFDLSLSAITLVLWSIFGMAGGLSKGAEGKIDRGKQPVFSYMPVAAASVGLLVVVLACANLLSASNLENMGVTYLKNNNASLGVASLEKAVVYNPVNADYRVALSQVYSGLGKGDAAVAEAGTAVDLSPYRFAVRDNYVKIALTNGQSLVAAKENENLISLAPNNVETYEQYASNYVNLGVKELRSGKKETAREYLSKAISVTQLIDNRAKNLDEKDKKMWSGPKLAVNDNIQLLLGQASYLMGKTAEAQKYWQQASNSKTKEVKGHALVWLALLQEKSGRLDQSQKTLEQASKLTPDFVKSFDSLKTVPTL